MWPFPASRSAYSTLPVTAADTDAPDHDNSLPSPTSTLASPPRSLSPAKDEKSQIQRMHRSRKGFLHSPLLIILTCILTLALTLSNAWVLLSLRPADPYAGDSNKPLRRPSQFIGLSRLNFSSFPAAQHPPHKLITFASLVQPLHRPLSGLFLSTPEKKFQSDPRSHFTRFGTISPEDRPLYVSNPENISTILQFRARDFGLEMCRLILELPKTARYTPGKDKEARHEDENGSSDGPRQRNWRLEGDVSAIEIWHLTSTPSKQTADPTLWSNFIDGFTLSSKTLPIEHRHSRLGSLSLTPAFSTEKDHSNENNNGFSLSTPWFSCPADSIQTFEVFCTSPGCVMDVWQDKSKPVIGIALEQKETFM